MVIERLNFTRFLKIIRKNPANPLDSGGEGVIYIKYSLQATVLEKLNSYNSKSQDY